MPTLTIRADANRQIGTGHIMRTLALAQAARDLGGRVAFLVSEVPNTLESRILANVDSFERMDVEAGSSKDLHETVARAREFGSSWVVLDSYRFGFEFQSVLKDADMNVLFLDDYGHGRPYTADFVLNQNIGACKETYLDRSAHTELLLGPRYALLRKEFWAWRTWERDLERSRSHLLVTLGGSDPDNVTMRLVEALRGPRFSHLSVTIVVGAGHPWRAKLTEVAEKDGHVVLWNVDDMDQRMVDTDLAIGAAGSTAYELCFLALPALLVILTENQRLNGEKLQQAGAARCIGWHSDVDDVALADALAEFVEDTDANISMSIAGRRLVDGRGAHRVARRLNARLLSLRPVNREDRECLFEWANDPITRSNSFSHNPISWADHLQWFEDKLSDSNTAFFVGLDADAVPIGQVRFDRQGNSATISVSVAPNERGRGYGARLIHLGALHMEQRGITTIWAKIKPQNQQSISTFKLAGFKWHHREQGKASACEVYGREK